jgi:hypothetical protein
VTCRATKPHLPSVPSHLTSNMFLLNIITTSSHHATPTHTCICAQQGSFRNPDPTDRPMHLTCSIEKYIPSHPPILSADKDIRTDLGDVGSRLSQLTCPPRSATHQSTYPSNHSCTMHHVSTYQHHKRPRILPGLPPSSPRFFFPLPSGRLLAG